MGHINPLFSNYILDETRSPVARVRLLSNGVNANTRLVGSDDTAGDSGCLACGNCVDACPVVRQNVGLVFQQNLRTSMSLENFVQENCRRCYRCVASCPQVSKELKEYSSGFRRTEKLVHLLAALTILLLAATGVTHSHYKEVLGPLEAGFLKYAHRSLGVLSIIIPFLYYKLDISHFRRTVSRIFSWGEADRQWLQATAAHIFKGKREKPIRRQEFNPAQKAWYLFILSVFPILYLSGLAVMVFGGHEGQVAVAVRMLHLAFALSFDLMLFVHIYMKFIREWCRNGYLLWRNYQRTKSLVFKSN